MRTLILHSMPTLALRASLNSNRGCRRAISILAPRCQAQGDEGKSVPARREPSSAVGIYDPFADTFGFPFGRMSSLVDEFNQLARAFGMPTASMDLPAVGRAGPGTVSPRTLAVDIKDSSDKIEVKADVPGMKAQDVKVSVSPDNVLTLSAERKSEVKEGSEEEGNLRIERSYGSFVRRFRLPDNVDVEGIKASVKEGELHLTIPKTEVKTPEARDIPVASE